MIGWTPRPFIFVHIPKCAGTSIEQAFIPIITPFRTFSELTQEVRSQYWLPGNLMLQHSKLRRYSRHFPLEGFYKFAFVRNPWERAVSQIEYLQSIGARRFAEGNFKDWLKHYCETTDNVRGHDLGANQVDYLTDQKGNPAMDFIGRFENLATDFAKICAELGLESAPVLPQVFKSKRMRHYSAYYDDESEDWIRRRFAKDIREFGYKFTRNELVAAAEPEPRSPA